MTPMIPRYDSPGQQTDALLHSPSGICHSHSPSGICQQLGQQWDPAKSHGSLFLHTHVCRAQHQPLKHEAAWFLFSKVLSKVCGTRCFMRKHQVSFVSAGDNQVQIGYIFCKNIHSLPLTGYLFLRAVRVSITGFWDLVPRAFWCALDLLEGLVPAEDSRIYSQEPSFRSQTLNHELRWAIVT